MTLLVLARSNMRFLGNENGEGIENKYKLTYLLGSQ